jgi:heme oxygenase
MQAKVANADTAVVHPGPARTTRLAILRSETRAAHDRIELALPVMELGLTRRRYVQIIEALYGFYVGLEPLVDANPKLSKVTLLIDDLRVLGRASTDVRRCERLPRIATASSVLGARYVIEGATLGGQLVSRRLAQTLELDATTGASFFIGYGAQTRQMWSSFTAEVEAAPDFDARAAGVAAIATFETLEQWLLTSLVVS